MAYINVAEWSPDQVTDWLKGLDDSMYYYIKSFTNNEVRGHELLNIRPYELEQLGMYLIGHQEIVLEAVEHLRNFHYNLDKENLQFLAFYVATTAQCLHNELAHFEDKSKIETKILGDVTRTIATMKPLIGWLERTPFQGKQQFIEVRNKMLRLAIEMATSAQRDRFVENPVDQIKMTALRVANLANYIIQDISDPMILQPASLNLVTIRKKENELGFSIVPSYHGIHVVTHIKYNSPAHTSGKIEDGDEIVQINYQTVVGWQSKKVIDLLEESSPDILMTLKKRPKHTKIYGQIYMKPYRLPSKKKSLACRWGEALPSPRIQQIESMQEYKPVPLAQVPEKHCSSDSECSDILTPTNPNVSEKDLHFLPKSRAVLQRRNTICGDQVCGFKNAFLCWPEKKCRDNNDDSPSLRDKSVSFGFGLELTPRPTTCLGLSNSHAKFNEFSGLKGSLPDIQVEKKRKEENAVQTEAEVNNTEESSKPGISKMVRFDSKKEVVEYKDSKYTCNVENTILEVFEPIPYVDEDDSTNERKTLQLSNSIAHDNNNILNDIPNLNSIKTNLFNGGNSSDRKISINNDDIPPAIEPRKERRQPPAPPPRPKKILDAWLSLKIPPPIAPTKLTFNCNDSFLDAPNDIDNILDDDSNLSSDVNVSENTADSSEQTNSPTGSKIPATKHFLEERFEELEILTPGKSKNLTLKKKNSLMAKRRNISIKTLEISDIQGHLYRRSKDKHGVTYWAKLYFVLIDTSLYGFRTKESIKASCLIFLPGFTATIASEVHSKPNAFKVYHPTKTFYFAAESPQALNQWLEYIKQATLKGNTSALNVSMDQNTKELFSETDSSDSELDTISGLKHFVSPSTMSSGNKTTNKKNNHSDEHVKTEKYHLGFGSLKKFTKQSLPFASLSKAEKEKKNPSDVPVPTAQFRSYRKVPGNAGLQLGTSSMISSTGNSDFVPPTLSIIDSSYKFEHQQFDYPTPIESSLTPLSFLKSSRDSKQKLKNVRKQSPYNYIHASNPNLVEFDFPTSKALDFSFPKVNPSNSWDAHHNLQGFVTLKDLMLQKQEEDAQEMYNHRVCLGVEKVSDKMAKRKQRRAEASSSHAKQDENIPKPSVDKIQSRSLPKTPDYAQSFKPDDSDIIMTRSREGQKLRDFGYEFICGDDPNEHHHGNMMSNKHSADRPAAVRKKGLNWISSGDKNKTDEDKVSRSSFKKSKNKLMAEKFESFKTSSERLFQFKNSNSNNDKDGPKDRAQKLKPSTSYSPLTLPLNKKSSHVYNIQGDGGGSIVTTNLKKSNTYNTPDFRDVGIQLPSAGARKNSVPERSASYFTKLTFSGKSAKEKRLLGSPRLHRAIFGRRESTETQQLDHELFSPIEQKPRTACTTPESSDHLFNHSTPLPQKMCLSTSAHTIGSPDYPNLEYPPVFEAETYSLSDPHTSLTLLRRRNHNQSK